MELKGIDVSKWNGTIDWQRVAADGVRFAMVRAATGSKTGKINIDPKFVANVNGAHAAGIRVGLYLYSYAYTVDAARKEATNLVQAIAKHFATLDNSVAKITWPVAYDIEEKAQGTTARRATNTAQATAFLGVVKAAGYTPMLYTNAAWLASYIDYNGIKAATGADLWLADWRKGIKPDSRATIWQYEVRGTAADVKAKKATVVGKIDGVAGKIDVNVAYKDYAVSQRPDWLTEPAAPTPTLAHEAAIDALYAAGQLNSPEYWRQVCNGKATATADNVRALLAKWADAIKPR